MGCCSGGRGGRRAGGGVGAPAPAHVLPATGGRSPARAFWASAAAPPEPGRGICLPPVGGKGAPAGAPSSAPSGSCQSPGSAWHPAGLPEETLSGVAALLEGRGGFGGVWRKLGAPAAGPQGPHPEQLRPTKGRRCGPVGPCVRGDTMSSLETGQRPGLAPSRSGGPAALSGRPPE